MLKSLFDFLFKKEREDLTNKILELQNDSSTKEEELVKLREELSPRTKEDSFVTFTIDKDLKVSINSKVNNEIIIPLINNDIIKSNESDNVEVLQLALILIVNEASEQLLMGLNSNE